MRAHGLLLGLAAFVVAAGGASSATATSPIGGGHYVLDTPQSAAHLFPGRWPAEDDYGKGWSMHVHSSGRNFTTYAFLDVSVPCSRWETQNWGFNLDGRTEGQAPVRIWANGTFASLRRGERWGLEYRTDRPHRTTGDARGWLDINGRLTSRARIRGTLRAWSSDGCDTGWMPYRGRFFRTGWETYLDRT